MTNQHNNAQVASKPFALICSFQVPTTELDPDLIPSVSVVVGAYETLEQAKHARQAIQHAAFLARQQRIKARQQQAQNTSNTIAATTITNADTSENDKEAHHV